MASFQRYQPEIIPTSRCPSCNGKLHVRDTVERFIRISAIEKYRITIRRLMCDVCGKLHRELPDFLLPHKHYPAECIEAEIDRENQVDSIENCDIICAYPELSTLSRWRKEFGQHQVGFYGMQSKDCSAEGHCCSVYARCFSCCKNLQRMNRKNGIGWLADCIRTTVNDGFVFCTEFAFPKNALPAMMKEAKACTTDEHCFLTQNSKKGGCESVKENENSILKWLLLEICRVYFQDSTAYMAAALGFPQKALQSTLTCTGGKRIVDVFEEAMRYCARNHLGLDAMLMQFPNTGLD